MAERKGKGKGLLWLLLLLGGGGVLVAASGAKKEPTTTEKHTDCVNGFCVEVNGLGVDKCAIDGDCVPSVPKHTACVNGICTLVEGEGNNECSVDQSCVASPTHKECQNGKCITVLGEEIDTCTGDGDCVPPPIDPCSVLSMKVTKNPPTPLGSLTDINVEVTNTSNSTFQMKLTMFDFGTNGTGAANFNPITTEKLITVPPGNSTYATTPMTRVDVNPSQLSVVLYKTTDGKACTGTLVDIVNDPAATPLSCSLSLVSNKDLAVTVDASVLGGAEPYDIAILWGDGDVTQVNAPGQYSHTYPNAGTTDVVLSLQDAVGTNCSDTISNLTIDPPAITCSASLVSQFGSTVTIDISVTGGSAPYSIIMDFGDGIAIGTNTVGQHNHTYAQPGTYNINISITDDNFDSCSDSIPNVVVTGSGGGGLSCKLTFISKNGLTANFNIDVQGGDLPYDIAVDWDDGKTSTNLSSGAVSHTYPSTGIKYPVLQVGTNGKTFKDPDCVDLEKFSL